MTNYAPEQLKKLYDKLPQEIKDMAIADETTDVIIKILEDNGLGDERGRTVSDLIRNVLFGLLPPEDFAAALEEELKITKVLAKKVAQEVNRFIFFPIKESLGQLYRSTAESPNRSDSEASVMPQKSAQSDTYREPLE